VTASGRPEEDRRDAIDRRFLDQPDPQAGLAAARHPDDHAVRRQIARVVQDRLGGDSYRIIGLRCARTIVGNAPPQVEHAQLFEILHAW
jgi:hypothetical protein